MLTDYLIFAIVQLKTVKKEFEDLQNLQEPNRIVELASKKLNISDSTLFDCLALAWVRNCIKREDVSGMINLISKRLNSNI